MVKKPKQATDSSDLVHQKQEDEIIHSLIEKRKLQQKALQKIMTSIDKPTDHTIDFGKPTRQNRKKIN